MNFKHYHSSDRGLKDLGWLQSNFTFSFGSYSNPANAGFGLLRVFNDDFVSPGNGFGLHAHQNMEIISIMLQGTMNHKDSLGYSEVVGKDWVQIMSAGSGLRHEEYNVGEDEVNFLQIWIEPKLQNINPRYQRRYFPQAERKNQLTTVVSTEEGTAHCWINQSAKLSLGFFESDTSHPYIFNPTNKSVFIFVMSGEIKINEESISSRNAMGIWGTGNFDIKIIEESHFLIIEAPINT